jgi:phosphohistidine swiveling domain-containing protein
MNYIAQEYKRAVRGGVMIVPKARDGEIIIETAASPTEVTDGSQNPEVTKYKLSDDKSRYAPWQLELLRTAHKIQDSFEIDQELEWLQTKSGQVYILQTRPFITDQLSYEAVIQAEQDRLASYKFHNGTYETEYLPDIDKPTPLTLELIQRIYTQGMIDEGIAKSGSQPLLIIAANIYLDKAYYRKLPPIYRQLSQLRLLYKAYRQYNSPPTLTSNVSFESPNQAVAYILSYLTQPVFRNTRQLQLVQALLSKKLRIPVTHPAFLEVQLSPLQKAAQNKSSNELLSEFWYLASNEYELSEPRYAEYEAGLEKLNNVAKITTDKKSISKERTELIDTLISSFDAAYCNNLFKLYDYLAQHRSILHYHLIQTIASIRKLLLATDAEHGLRNLIWYATFQEIEQNSLPGGDALRKRKLHWQTLQTLPLPHPNELESWNDLVIQKPATNSSIFKGIKICPGLVKGTIGKEIKVTEALTQDILLEKSIKGIITERGGSLSHIAILARERHIAILRVENATANFKRGQKILLDADQGSVQIY